jgi:hypothetical protein
MAFGDLAMVKAEPDLEKRSELALANADQQIDTARKAYDSGDNPALKAALDEVAESVDLSYDALRQTHKVPRKNKYYKRAELKVTAMLRRLAGLRDEVGYESRPLVEAAYKKLSDIHDNLLADIMSRKK